ncbi:unnamed protein product [Caenorhabditis brenneri]
MLPEQQIATDGSETPEKESDLINTESFSSAMSQNQSNDDTGSNEPASSTTLPEKQVNIDELGLQPKVTMLLEQLQIIAKPKQGPGKYFKHPYSTMKNYAKLSLKGHLRKIVPYNYSISYYGTFEGSECFSKAFEKNQVKIVEGRDYLDDMNARATRMEELKKAAIDKEVDDVMEREIKYVFTIIINRTVEDKEVHELLKANEENFLHSIFLEICDEKTHLLEQKYTEKEFSSYKAVLNNVCSKFPNTEPNSQEMAILKQHIEIAYLKTHSYRIYEKLRTSVMIIDGLKELSSKRMQRIWHEILAEPVSKISWELYNFESRMEILNACNVINKEYIEHILKPIVLNLPLPDTEKINQDPLHEGPPEKKRKAFLDSQSTLSPKNDTLVVQSTLFPTNDSLNSPVSSISYNNLPSISNMGAAPPTTTPQNQFIPIVPATDVIQWFQTFLQQSLLFTQQQQQVPQVQPILLPPTPLPEGEGNIINSLVFQSNISRTSSIFPTIPQIFEQVGFSSPASLPK